MRLSVVTTTARGVDRAEQEEYYGIVDCRLQMGFNALVSIEVERTEELGVQASKRRRGTKRREAVLAGLFGLGCALTWHFVHLAGEKYQAGPASPDFWFHLAVEGVITLYAAGLFLIFYKLLTRPRPPISPYDKP